MYSINPTPYEAAEELARRFRIIRKQKKISQLEMAERSGVSLGSLKRFERTGKISLESLLKLMHLLGRLNELQDVFTVKDNPKDLEKLFTN